ncbi:unnamed protein product [Ilex paraguariensis]|uniref:Uncharacterized protein n=1 Tax=Ilex paraguariensis TaxID=185542 RepID=A0ABC8TAU2_9AQUA
MANEGSNHGVVVVIQGEMEDEVDASVEMLGTSVVTACASMDEGENEGAHCIGQAGAGRRYESRKGRATQVASEQDKKLGALGADSNKNLSATLGAGLDSYLGTTLIGLGEHNVRVIGQRCGQRKVLASGVLGSPLGKGKERKEEPLGVASTHRTAARVAQELGEHGDSLGEPEAALGAPTSQGLPRNGTGHTLRSHKKKTTKQSS